MSYKCPKIASAASHTVTSVSAQLGTLVAGTYYDLTCTTATWVTQGANPTAVAAAASTYLVPAGGSLLVDGLAGAKLAVIRDSADGTATLTPLRFVR